PAWWPPIPSATANTPSSSFTRIWSSLWSRLRPTSVRPAPTATSPVCERAISTMPAIWDDEVTIHRSRPRRVTLPNPIFRPVVGMLPAAGHAVSSLLMKAPKWLAAAFLLTLAGACFPAYIDTIAPKDASFAVECGGACGQAGKDQAVMVNVTFLGHDRQLTLCCADRGSVLAQLKTIRDFWCDGLDVAEKTIGDLKVG